MPTPKLLPRRLRMRLTQSLHRLFPAQGTKPSPATENKHSQRATSTDDAGVATTDTPQATAAEPQPTAQASTVAVLASLETLPFEIQGVILSQAPTLDSLRALVHASSQLHSVYSQDRLRILSAFVEQSLDGILFDAHAAYLSGTDEFQLTRDEPMLWAFLDDFKNRRTTVAPSDLAAQLALQDLVQLARFHQSIIEPLTERYSVWALAALSSSPQDCPLSGTERRRIQRALYHYQIYCNLCGSRGEGRSSPRRLEDPLEGLRILSLFPAWQIEEVLCINEFAKDTYGGVYHRVTDDLDDWEIGRDLFTEPEGCKSIPPKCPLCMYPVNPDIYQRTICRHQPRVSRVYAAPWPRSPVSCIIQDYRL